MKLECLTVCADLTDMSFPLSISEVCGGITTWREIDRLVGWSMEGSGWVVYLLLIHLFLPFSFVFVSSATERISEHQCLNSVWIIFRASTTVRQCLQALIPVAILSGLFVDPPQLKSSDLIIIRSYRNHILSLESLQISAVRPGPVRWASEAGLRPTVRPGRLLQKPRPAQADPKPGRTGRLRTLDNYDTTTIHKWGYQKTLETQFHTLQYKDFPDGTAPEDIMIRCLFQFWYHITLASSLVSPSSSSSPTRITAFGASATARKLYPTPL